MDTINVARMYHRHEVVDWNLFMQDATLNNHLEIVQFCIQHGASIHKNVIELAITFGYIDIIKLFVRERHDMSDWNTYMYIAASHGQIELVKYFAEMGADNWNWCMIYAASFNNREIIDLCIEHGADDWNLSIIYAITDRGNLDLVKFFIEKGANNYQQYYDYATAPAIKDYLRQFI
jgi:ankyrin repeat protein